MTENILHNRVPLWLLIAAILFMFTGVGWWIHEGREFNKVRETVKTMNLFINLVDSYMLLHRKVPGYTFSEAWRTLLRDRELGVKKVYSEETLQMLNRNQDAWGHAFIYEVKGDIIFLKSQGKNRLENGKDDICKQANIRWLKDENNSLNK